MRMHHAEVLIARTVADQLAAERSWLRGETSGSFLAPLQNWKPPQAWIDTAKRIERVLAHPDLSNFLRVLRDRNKEHGTQFLLAPHLFYVIRAAEDRQSTIAKTPALGRRPAELRAHFKKASAKTAALARLVWKGPEPHIALAAMSDYRKPWPLRNHHAASLAFERGCGFI
jgi:hypothetical protein